MFWLWFPDLYNGNLSIRLSELLWGLEAACAQKVEVITNNFLVFSGKKTSAKEGKWLCIGLWATSVLQLSSAQKLCEELDSLTHGRPPVNCSCWHYQFRPTSKQVCFHLITWSSPKGDLRAFWESQEPFDKVWSCPPLSLSRVGRFCKGHWLRLSQAGSPGCS